MPRNYRVIPEPSRPIRGAVSVPGDKSISHRAAIVSALAEGETFLHGFLESEDCLATLGALKALGIEVRRSPQTCREQFWVIEGKGLCGLSRPAEAVDCGNSGTTMRLLAGVLATQPFDSELVGDESLMQRPMRRIADPLNAAGAGVETSGQGTPPLRIHSPGKGLQAIDYVMPVASAQVKSALMLAGLCAGVSVDITEPDVSRDHTERMLAAFGVPILREGNRVSLQAVPVLKSPGAIDVPGDLSSAAFFMVLAAVSPGAELCLRSVGFNPTRNGAVTLLQRMGADITVTESSGRGGEPLADITVKHSELKAIDIDASDVALAVDEIPVVMIAAACAKGTTRLRGAEELRVKESDRLGAMARGLSTLGIAVEEFPDGLDVTGGTIGGGDVDSLGDHRVAMSFAIAATLASSAVTIRNVDNVATSFPGFCRQLDALGIAIEEEVQ